jgi:hypothetical protein
MQSKWLPWHEKNVFRKIQAVPVLRPQVQQVETPQNRKHQPHLHHPHLKELFHLLPHPYRTGN